MREGGKEIDETKSKVVSAVEGLLLQTPKSSDLIQGKDVTRVRRFTCELFEIAIVVRIIIDQLEHPKTSFLRVPQHESVPIM